MLCLYFSAKVELISQLFNLREEKKKQPLCRQPCGRENKAGSGPRAKPKFVGSLRRHVRAPDEYARKQLFF